MSGAWWNNDPVIAARNIHIEWEVFRMTTETIVCFLSGICTQDHAAQDFIVPWAMAGTTTPRITSCT